MPPYESHLALIQGIKQIFVDAKFCTEGNFQKYGIPNFKFHNWTENNGNLIVSDGPSSAAN